MPNLHCNENCLRTWAANSESARLDYFSPHKLEEFHDEYFKNVLHRIKIGDVIHVKDPDGRRVEIEILYVDEETRKVHFGLLREVTVKPISASGFAIEYRRVGPTSEYFIIGPDGKTVEGDIVGPKGAKKALEFVEEQAAKAVEGPADPEPKLSKKAKAA